LQRKLKLNRAVFVQAFKELDEEGYIDKLAKALNLKPKTTHSARTAAAGTIRPAAKKPSPISGEKPNGRAVAGSIRLSSLGK